MLSKVKSPFSIVKELKKFFHFEINTVAQEVVKIIQRGVLCPSPNSLLEQHLNMNYLLDFISLSSQQETSGKWLCHQL